MQIVQPPVSSRSRSCEVSNDGSEDIIAEAPVDQAVQECEIISRMTHPNIVATFKYSQMPLHYTVSRGMTHVTASFLMCTILDLVGLLQIPKASAELKRRQS